jgi:hypothetical protein
MLGLPEALLAEADQAIEHRDDLYLLGCKFGQWFCRNGYSEEECADWLINESPLRGNYTARQFDYQLRRSVIFAYESHESGGPAAPGPEFVQGLETLAERVKESKVRDSVYLLALIQHAINTGHNPVNASSRQIAAIAGRSVAKTAQAMNRMQETLCGGFLAKVTYDGIYGHSRLWELNVGGLHIYHACYISNPPDHDAKFVAFVEPLPMGTELTVTLVAAELSITRPRARKLLDKYTDEYLGGGFFKGDRKNRLPATWRRQPAEDQRVAAAESRIEATKAKFASMLHAESVCIFVECGETAPLGQRYCPPHEESMAVFKAR